MKVSPSCLCIIGARAGSLRLPGKNKKSINGKPLYCITVENAVRSGIFSEIIFSTDDKDILEGLSAYEKITADKRPPQLAGSKVVMWDVGIYLLEKYAKRLKNTKDICFLTPCHPFRRHGHIREAYVLYKSSNATSLISVTELPSPPEFSIEMIDGKIKKDWDGPVRKGDRKKLYYPNGAITFVKKDYFLNKKDIYAQDTAGYLLSWPYSLDIDYAEDLELAKKLAGCFME